MSGKKTLVWAVGLLVLATFYYVYEIQGGKKRQAASRQRQLLLHVAPEAVTGLTLKRPSETVTAVRRQGHWHLTAPLSAAGDDQKYRELVRYLADLRYQRLVEAQPEALEPFGLTRPGLEIHLRLADASPPLIIRLGDQNPTGSGYYTQVEGKAAVYLVSTTAKNTLDASLYALRDKTVLAFDPADVQTLRLKPAATAAIVAQRQTGDHWRLTAPVHARGDDAQVDALLRRLRQTTVQKFVAEHPATLEPYGLHAPMLRLDLGLGKDRTVKTLLLGKLDAEAQGIYAKRRDTANVFLLPRPFWDTLPRTVTALRDKTLLRFESERIDRIEMRTPTEQIVITRTGPHQYRLEQPVRDAADRDAIEALLEDLKALEAKDFVAEAPASVAPYGLENPRLRITLSEQSDGDTPEHRRHTILIGDATSEPQGVYVRLATRSTVYLVDRTTLRQIVATTAFGLRDKHMLSFATDAVQKLQIQYPTSALTLERRGDAWTLRRPHRQTIPQGWKVDNILYELRTLEYAKRLTGTDKAAAYGLDTPRVRITMWQEDGTVIGSLAIGRAVDATGSDTQLVYARTHADPLLYAVKATFLEALPKNPADLTADK